MLISKISHHPPLCSAAVSRAHQFFTLSLSLTQSVAVTIAPVWAIFVISLNIHTNIKYTEEILTSLLPSAHLSSLLYDSSSVFLSFSATPARSAVNLTREYVIHLLMHAVCNNHRGRETHTCRRAYAMQGWLDNGMEIKWHRESMDLLILHFSRIPATHQPRTHIGYS